MICQYCNERKLNNKHKQAKTCGWFECTQAHQLQRAKQRYQEKKKRLQESSP